MPCEFLVSHWIHLAATVCGRIYLPAGYENSDELPVSAGHLFADEPSATCIAQRLFAVSRGFLLRLRDRRSCCLRGRHFLSVGILLPLRQSLSARHMGLCDWPSQ